MKRGLSLLLDGIAFGLLIGALLEALLFVGWLFILASALGWVELHDIAILVLAIAFVIWRIAKYV